MNVPVCRRCRLHTNPRLLPPYGSIYDCLHPHSQIQGLGNFSGSSDSSSTRPLPLPTRGISCVFSSSSCSVVARFTQVRTITHAGTGVMQTIDLHTEALQGRPTKDTRRECVEVIAQPQEPLQGRSVQTPSQSIGSRPVRTSTGLVCFESRCRSRTRTCANAGTLGGC